MVFGEAYQGMTDREILIEVAMQVGHQGERSAAQGIHLEKLEQKVGAIQCPSPRCQTNEGRITGLEQANEAAKEVTKEAKLSRQTWAGIIIVAVIAVVDILLHVAALVGV